MNKLAKLVADGNVSVEELSEATKLIERAELVVKGLEACKKTVLFPLGETEVSCYKRWNFHLLLQLGWRS